MPSRPRQILPGTTYLVTRRCSQRQFLLRPCEETTAIFRYVLSVAVRRFGMKLHAYCVLSNHYHLVLTDPHARLPAFGQYLDSLVARATNASLGRWENFWDTSSYSAVALVSPQDAVDRCAYVLANPAAAGLVRRGRDWPGLWSGIDRIDGDGIEAARPKGFFSETGSMPKAAFLRLTRPPCFATTSEFVEPLARALADAEVTAAATVAASGMSVLGVVRVLSQKPTSRPAPGEPRRALNPRVACRDKWRRIEALQRLCEFVTAYRTALAAWSRGVRDVVFPAGTYLMRIQHAVPCAST